MFVLRWAGPWSVCVAQTHLLVEQFPSVHRQQDSHVGLHRKHRKSKRNTKKIIQQKIHYSILVLDAELKKGWDEKLFWNWDVYRVNAFGDLWVYEVLFHFVKHYLLFFILKKKGVRGKIVEQGWIVRVPWGIVPWGEPLQRGGWSRAVNENTGWVLRRNFWKEVRKCEKIKN